MHVSIISTTPSHTYSRIHYISHIHHALLRPVHSLPLRSILRVGTYSTVLYVRTEQLKSRGHVPHMFQLEPSQNPASQTNRDRDRDRERDRDRDSPAIISISLLSSSHTREKEMNRGWTWTRLPPLWDKRQTTPTTRPALWLFCSQPCISASPKI